MKKLIVFLMAMVLLVGCQTENVNEIKDEETINKIEEKNKEKRKNFVKFTIAIMEWARMAGVQ